MDSNANGNLEATNSICIKNEAPNERRHKIAVQDAGFAVASMKITVGTSIINIENETHLDIAENTLHFVNVAKKDY